MFDYKRKILAIDDDPVTLKMIKELLTKLGYNVIVADSAVGGMKLIIEHDIEILLLDIMMPEMSGVEFLEMVRKRYNSLELPVIMVSGRIEDSNVIEALKRGANDYVVKPINFDVLNARIQTQLKLFDLSRENIVNRHAIKKNNAKTSFLADVSHELRNPMHGLLSFSRLGSKNAKEISKEKVEYYFEAIHSSGKRLLNLLNELLDLSKAESGSIQYEKSNVDLYGIVEVIAKEFESLVEEKNIALNLVEAEKKFVVNVDMNRIGQVIHNLISNSVKYSKDAQQIKVLVEYDTMKVLRDSVPAVRVSIIDHNETLTKEECESVFYKFERASEDASEGAGLGLFISRAYVDGHGGQIWAEANPAGTGNIFNFTLPLV